MIRKNHLRDLHTAGSSLYKRIYIYIYIYIYTHIYRFLYLYIPIHIHKLLLHIHIIGVVLIYVNRFCQNTWPVGSSQWQLSVRNRAIWRMTIWTKYTKQREREKGEKLHEGKMKGNAGMKIRNASLFNFKGPFPTVGLILK